jgi:CRISPR-associated exonuclease Cas4
VIGAPERPLFDSESMLTGKPDYLVEKDGAVIPVEIKSGWAPPQPHEGHIYQVLAYCLLVERTSGRRPPYGILRYRNRAFAVDYTREAERELLRLLEEMHAAGYARELHRTHEDRARCLRCGYRSTCEEKL